MSGASPTNFLRPLYLAIAPPSPGLGMAGSTAAAVVVAVVVVVVVVVVATLVVVCVAVVVVVVVVEGGTVVGRGGARTVPRVGQGAGHGWWVGTEFGPRS